MNKIELLNKDNATIEKFNKDKQTLYCISET